MDIEYYENYKALATAIIEQACKDYVKALNTYSKNPRNYMALRTINDCERFFRSKEFPIYTNMDGETIIEHLREYGFKTIKRRHPKNDK